MCCGSPASLYVKSCTACSIIVAHRLCVPLDCLHHACVGGKRGTLEWQAPPKCYHGAISTRLAPAPCLPLPPLSYPSRKGEHNWGLWPTPVGGIESTLICCACFVKQGQGRRAETRSDIPRLGRRNQQVLPRAKKGEVRTAESLGLFPC